jgi:four helix bundle protein
LSNGVIAQRFEDLIVWQRANELKEGVFAFTDRPLVRRDFKYCNQIQESARSATRNVAEGFGRYYPKEFRHFLRIAAGSLHETSLKRLCLRAIKANNRLMAYLRAAEPPEPEP